ncbi:MAG: flippase activity-associated protein Agl23 [Anaerolineales bacterium]
MSAPAKQRPALLDTPLERWIPFNLETLTIAVIFLAAVVSRFYDLGARAISHDEVNHVVPAYAFYQNGNYSYDPLSHGPLQFHMMALSYFLFGDDDFTSRIPAATFSVAVVLVGMLLFRRYFGRAGAIAAGLMLLISPFMLYYGRYARNEVYIVMWGLLTLYAILRYLEKGERWALFLFTAANAFHFVDKATSYIFAAMELIFLAVYLLDRLTRREWPRPRLRQAFIILLSLSILLWAGAAGVYLEGQRQAAASAALSAPLPDEQATFEPVLARGVRAAALAMGALGLILAAAAAVTLGRGLGWDEIRRERSFDLAWLLGTLILPLLAAIVPALLGRLPPAALERLPAWLQPWNPRDYLFVWPGWDLAAIFSIPLVRTLLVILVLTGVAIWLGRWWNRQQWPLHVALFYVPFVLFYTSFFTNPAGLWGGFTGALGYWMEQQAVMRGGQPWYYYAFLQIPLYEFLPALGVLVAAGIAASRRLWQSRPGAPFESGQGEAQPVPVVALCVFWSLASLVALTLAGEKMPWLTIHIALPMILTTAWAVGWLVEGAGRPGVRGGGGILRVAMIGLFAVLALFTARAAYRAAYLFYDYPYEYLVYAHGTPDAKATYEEIAELSERITGGADLVVAYDNNVRYSYWWYMRHFPNRLDYNTEPSRDLRRAVVIVASPETIAQLGPVVRDDYYAFNYNRLWWPNLDYWSLKWENIEFEYQSQAGYDQPLTLPRYLQFAWRHIQPFFTDPAVRSAVWQIWFNRDYREWAALRASNAYTLTNWGVAERMTLYLRKDVNSLIWNYGSAAGEPVVEAVDPYQALTLPFEPERALGGEGSAAGQFLGPRAIAVAPDGSLYVADSRNHRIQHLSPEGEVLHVWGGPGSGPGQFNEPWGVAVSPDGRYVYVCDTWNHRVQQFTASGRFLRAWGFFGTGESPQALYGPRGVAVDSSGRVYVADTGNKRILVFDAGGNYLTQIGSPGFAPGQFDEPVGVAVGADGLVYVSDTWNRRLQVFVPEVAGGFYYVTAAWPVEGWYGQSLENKPFVAVGADGRIYLTDPEACRVIELDEEGRVSRVWGGCGGELRLPDGLALDGQGGLWVGDAGSGRLFYLRLDEP